MDTAVWRHRYWKFWQSVLDSHGSLFDLFNNYSTVAWIMSEAEDDRWPVGYFGHWVPNYPCDFVTPIHFVDVASFLHPSCTELFFMQENPVTAVSSLITNICSWFVLNAAAKNSEMCFLQGEILLALLAVELFTFEFPLKPRLTLSANGAYLTRSDEHWFRCIIDSWENSEKSSDKSWEVLLAGKVYTWILTAVSVERVYRVTQPCYDDRMWSARCLVSPYLYFLLRTRPTFGLLYWCC